MLFESVCFVSLLICFSIKCFVTNFSKISSFSRDFIQVAVGLLGLATSFFNAKNRNIARDLAELVVEANQELPEWLEELSADAQRYGSRPGRGKGGR